MDPKLRYQVLADVVKVIYDEILTNGFLLKSELVNVLMREVEKPSLLRKQFDQFRDKKGKLDERCFFECLMRDILNESLIRLDGKKIVFEVHKRTIPCPFYKEMDIDINDSPTGSKLSVARKTVEFLNEQNIKLAYFTLGTTVLEVAKVYKEWSLDKEKYKKRKFKPFNIYSNSIPIICELGPYGLVYPYLMGTIYLDKAGVYNDNSLEGVNDLGLDTVVCSFKGLSYDHGFTSNHQTEDRPEKRSNLLNNRASKIVIPLCWDKFGNTVEDNSIAPIGDIIKYNEEAESGKDNRVKKKYYIITNRPSNWETAGDEYSQTRCKEFAKWKQLIDNQIVEFVIAEETNQAL